MNTKVKVTNLENNKNVVLTINDRGPFLKNRIIDVSEKAAKLLDMKIKGVAKVMVEHIEN
jgi:rare lipoprotein A